MDYLFGLARNRRLEAEIGADLAWAAGEHARSGHPARRFKDFFYAIPPQELTCLRKFQAARVA